MVAESKIDPMDPKAVQETILKNRASFVAYNIARLRELVRYLSDKKMDMFSTIPFLLHINSPEWPGFLEHEQAPCGIHGFFDSGFWKLARKRLGFDQQEIRRCIGRAFYIKGIYLMGSAGSLGQTDHSDFDYWVVVDEHKMGSTERGLLRKKLRLIEQWANDQYNHHVTFFVLDSQQVRDNRFSGIAEEGFRITQKTILKEEFYRTFILIAGQVPYWAVLPPDLSNEEYDTWVHTASHLSHAHGSGFHADDYMDLGNISTIESGECLGSVLWQFCKAQEDPVKALLKASLIVSHLLYQKEDGLLCHETKRKMAHSRLDSYMLDPYAFVFDKIIDYYKKTKDEDGLELIKTCIYFRMTGYPTPSYPRGENPKRRLLDYYLRDWSWNDLKTKYLLSFPTWTESDKLRFEKKIRDRLWAFYKTLLRMVPSCEPQQETYQEDLNALKNKASAQLKTKDGKIPWASNYLRLQQGTYPLYVAYMEKRWAVYDGRVNGSPVRGKPFFSAQGLLHVIGWIVLNGLYNGDQATVSFLKVPAPLPLTRAQILLDTVYEHFSGALDPHLFREQEPECRKMCVVFDTSRYPNTDVLPAVDFLVQNTWGEFFYHVVDLKQYENKWFKYDEIAKQVATYLPNKSDEGSFRLVDLRTVEDLSAEGEILFKAVELLKDGDMAVKKGSPEQKRVGHGICCDGVMLDLY